MVGKKEPIYTNIKALQLKNDTFTALVFHLSHKAQLLRFQVITVSMVIKMSATKGRSNNIFSLLVASFCFPNSTSLRKYDYLYFPKKRKKSFQFFMSLYEINKKGKL